MVDGAPRFRPEEPHDRDSCCVCHSGGDQSAMGQYFVKGELVKAHLKCARLADLEPIDAWLRDED
jgi:hypothetical protein